MLELDRLGHAAPHLTTSGAGWCRAALRADPRAVVLPQLLLVPGSSIDGLRLHRAAPSGKAA